ncbi:MAG: hypothetical protein EON55_14830, partial [Alphaproteobacteria bacterium]
MVAVRDPVHPHRRHLHRQLHLCAEGDLDLGPEAILLDAAGRRAQHGGTEPHHVAQRHLRPRLPRRGRRGLQLQAPHPAIRRRHDRHREVLLLRAALRHDHHLRFERRDHLRQCLPLIPEACPMRADPTHRISPAGRLLRRLRDERGGNVLMVFALALIPLIGLSGLGVDYVRGINYRTHFDRASDAATITAIATARDYISTNPKNEADPTASALALARTRGLAAFRVNAGPMLNSLPLTPNLTVTRTGNVVSASASYASSYESPFSRAMGNLTSIAVSGVSTSSLTLGNYTDFYLLLDTSGSMGFPTSSTAQVQFARLNPDMADAKGNNCAFACHFTGSKGFNIAKNNNIELRIATVSNAVQQLIAKAQTNQTLVNQYR